MKKTRFIALLITATMITTSTVSIPAYAQETATPSSSVGNTTGEWENKLGDPIYAEILNNADENEKFMTIIRIPDMADHEAIEKEAQSITGINEENYDTISESEYNEELAKWSAEDEELLKNASNPEDMKKSIIDGRVRENKANRFARIVNQLTADVYTEENAKILAKLGVAEEDVIDVGTDTPTLILNLTKSEIERIAAFDDVKCIDLDIFRDVPQIEEIELYRSGDFEMNGSTDSADALALLRGSIENKEFTQAEMWLCDLDGDGIITSNDALLVLRKSVGYSD